MGNQEIFMFYFIFILGIVFVLAALCIFIAMYIGKDYRVIRIGKSIGILLFGVLLLYITLPSLKFMVLKEYDVVKGKCVIDIDSSGRSSEADLTMSKSKEVFAFKDIPALNAYGKSVPYYCETTVTKDHMFEISYKIYDIKTRMLMASSN